MKKALSMSIAALLFSASVSAFAQSQSAGSANLDLGITDGNTAASVQEQQKNKVSDNAFQHANGINQTQQNNGNNSSTSQGVSISMNTGVRAHANDQQAGAGNMQGAMTTRNTAVNLGNKQSNRVTDNAFEYANGINQASQNNGNNSTMQQGSSIALNTADEWHNQTAVSLNAMGSAVAGNLAVSIGDIQNNKIDDNAFRCANGINQVAQNNGNNSIGQQSVSVSVNMGGGLL